MNPGESALDLAARRLENALHVLEQRLAQRLKAASDDAGGLFDHDRSMLAAELDAARARERELEEAGPRRRRRWAARSRRSVRP